MDKAYMYVVRCKDDTLYTGYTTNLERRIRQHNEGKGAKYTRARRPVHLIFAETFNSKKEAMQAEYAFKQKTKAQKLAYIAQHTK